MSEFAETWETPFLSMKTRPISLKLLPSQSLDLFNREHVDVIFLLNYGKSSETGQVFGYKVFNHYFKQISNEDYLATNHKPLYDLKIPVIQIERPGEEDGSIISWNVFFNEQLEKNKKNKRSILGFAKKNMIDSLSFDFDELFNGIKDALSLTEVAPEEVVNRYFSQYIEEEDNRSVEKILKNYSDFDETSHYTYRKIHGVSPDENIFVNGIVVGYAEAESVVLIAQDGIIIDIIDGVIKDHGVEKLGPVDLNNVIVKTGLLRKTADITPRVLDKENIQINETESILYSEDISEDARSFKIGYVDHAAYDIYKFKNFDLVITVGDDTSLVASDILYRFNIPIIGITDGDLDKVVEKGFVNEKSSFIEVASGFDDIVGRNIYEKLFFSNQTLEIPYKEDLGTVEEFKTNMFDVFKSHVIQSVKELVPSFIEKNHEYVEVYSYNEVIEENPELVEALDEFIDGFEYEPYEEAIESDEIYYIENEESPEEVYVEEEISDLELEEILLSYSEEGPVKKSFVESDDYDLDEIFVDSSSDALGESIDGSGPIDDGFVEDDSSNVLDDGSNELPIDEVYLDPVEDNYEEEYVDEAVLDDEPIYEEIYIDEEGNVISVEEYPDGHRYVETLSDDVPIEEAYIGDGEDTVEEIYVEHDIDLDGSAVEEIYVEHDSEQYVEEAFVEEDIGHISIEEVFLDDDLEDSEEESYFDESLEENNDADFVDNLDNDDLIEESADDENSVADDESSLVDDVDSSYMEKEDIDDDSDGWGEYIESEFGDLDENHNESDNSD